MNSHTQKEYLENLKHRPILECAEALDRPIYIHPRCPSEGMDKPYGDYGLYTAMWGFQAEVSVHCLRMILCGLFERFPKLKIVIGHMGESIPFNLWRCDFIYGIHKSWADIPGNEKPSEVFKRNFWITTSGVEHAPALKYCIEVLGAGPRHVGDRLSFSAEQAGHQMDGRRGYFRREQAQAVSRKCGARVSYSARVRGYG